MIVVVSTMCGGVRACRVSTEPAERCSAIIVSVISKFHMPFAHPDNIVTGGGYSSLAIGWVRQYPQLCGL